MENLKKVLLVAVLWVVVSAGIALLSDLANKPADIGYAQRFFTFLIGLGVAFAILSVAGHVNDRNAKS
ncbi:MAG TPA: hypothetical protein VIS56_01965 [Candidatus Saccharimonadales bacterium]